MKVQIAKGVKTGTNNGKGQIGHKDDQSLGLELCTEFQISRIGGFDSISPYGRHGLWMSQWRTQPNISNLLS